MGTLVRDILMQSLADLRYEPVPKRIRAWLGGRVVIDTDRAVLVWEPKRVVPSYAVPVEQVAGILEPAFASVEWQESAPNDADAPHLGDRPVYDPRVPFGVHTTDGEPLDIRSGDTERRAAAFRPADAALNDYVILDFGAFDRWYEEDEPNIGHPRDPFHRIEIVHSSRPVRVELDGELLAESVRPYLLIEAPLPVRYYLPRDDVIDDLLRPSPSRTICAYKGQAHYWSLDAAEDIAWSYPQPLREADEIAGRIAFFNERVDLMINGRRLARPITPWSH
jgi:uncharacterized protein (DUF427 family)